MQKCHSCGADLPENARFCGKCGSVQDPTGTDAATTRSNTPQPEWTPEGGTFVVSQSPSMYPTVNAYATPDIQPSRPGFPSTPPPPPPPPPGENEDERKAAPLFYPLYGSGVAADALVNSGQAYGTGAPVVQGTPSISNAPQVGGSPTPYTNYPNAPSQGAGYQPQASHYAQPGQQSTSYPPEQSGTPGQHKRHAHHAHHAHHTATVTKVAGGSTIKTVIIVVTAIVVVTGGGIAAAAYFLNRPQPLISATSTYKVGGTLAGADGTILHVTGQKFSGNSTITFLLDGKAAPGSPNTQSDSNGNFSADVHITNAWSPGTHTLTARDTSNYSTKNSVSVIIVQPGSAHTPGPNGAPPDDATFTLGLSGKGTLNSGNQPFTRNETLHITGHPDPQGGTVCQDGDNNQQLSSSETTVDTGLSYTTTYSYSCQGSYKGGKITYTETLVSNVITYTSSGVKCTLASPQTSQQVTGTYTSQHTFSGTITFERIPQTDFNCTQSNWYFFYVGGQGNWTGTIAGL